MSRRRRWSQRRLVTRIAIVAVSVVVVLVAALAGTMTWFWARADVNTIGRVDFDHELAIPPLADSQVAADGTRVFDLNLRTGHREFRDGKRTETWGVNGDYLGPTLRAKRGEKVQVNVHNGLPEQSTIHWHGMHVPARMDGGPHQPVAPGQTWSPHWQIDQPAATLWYHPHPHGETAKHVYRGIAGMFILDDDQAGALDLPDTYGVDDIPVIVQDRKFKGDGSFNDNPAAFRSTGLLGDTILVNGTVGPYQEVTTEKVRLRLLNGSNARVYNFGLSDDRKFAVIGSDGGLLAAPHRVDRITLSPGERSEIVVDMRPGERVVLRSYAPDLGAEFANDRFAGGDDRFDVLQLRAADRLEPSAALPDRLVDVPRLRESDAAQVRTFELSGRSINEQKMDMGRIDETVTVGDTEVWSIHNDSGLPHNFHVHDVQFQVLRVDGGQPPPELRGWKDTVLMRPDTTVDLIMRFSDYADPDTPYMYHCHLLSHEDSGMMGQFVVVKKGQQAGQPPHDHTH